ncbi:hypothetical protein IQ31_03107 [Sphingobacterium siyangense]|uniref:Uncharacterized protein n=1 Tax=Sphingobacterium siyangense TaxID=459529 RepID=A0A562MFI4_9SPHI|nr:hypothetical protein IQ31_03107 [Sphingobacterium siyangense]
MLVKHKFGTNVLHEVNLFEEKIYFTLPRSPHHINKFTSKQMIVISKNNAL